MRIRWVTQNEATDADGFLLEGVASFAAELTFLRLAGCPDAANARLVSVEVTGRDESITTAEVSSRMACWLENETDAEPADF